MLDYSSLDAVAAVVREGSFERAAAVLSVTPSAISQRVRGLEERVGAILITRGQPCRATAIGARLCAHVEQVRLMEADVTRTLPNFTEAPTATRLTVHVAVNADSLNTWFAPAAAAFAAETGALLNIILEDEAYTAERLRNGDVLAAVTSDPVPVQGCRTMPLGALRYVATASPDFTDRFFSKGTNKETLNAAPMICFNRRDLLQADWAREAFDIELEAPTHWVPATQAFLDMSLAGWGGR